MMTSGSQEMQSKEKTHFSSWEKKNGILTGNEVRSKTGTLRIIWIFHISKLAIPFDVYT
jgi:hypothetical protein